MILLIIYLIGVYFSAYYLKSIKDVEYTLFKSIIHNNKNENIAFIIAVIIFPYTFFKLYKLNNNNKIKINMKNISKTIKYTVAILLVLITVNKIVNISNQDVLIKNQFKQKISYRIVQMNKMYNTIYGKSDISIKFDSSFYRNISVIMENRKDAPELFMKWISESNPNANVSEVSALYQDLSMYISSERVNLTNCELELQNLKLQHDNLMTLFPSSIFMKMLGRKSIEYIPMLSVEAKYAQKTNIDNNKVFR